jgi:hypothetical protein
LIRRGDEVAAADARLRADVGSPPTPPDGLFGDPKLACAPTPDGRYSELTGSAVLRRCVGCEWSSGQVQASVSEWDGSV